LATHPVIRRNIEAYQHILVPVVFIGLGIFILLKNGTLVLIAQIL
jgi:cadmium resistance protein CadD (predicted permease)